MQAPDRFTEDLNILPVDENHPLCPVDINGINKMAGEWYHLVYNNVYKIKSVVLRLTNTYGPRMRVKDARQTFLGIWIKNVIEGNKILVFGDGKQIRDFNYVDDVVSAILLSAQSNEVNGMIFNLGADDPINLEDTAKLMIEISNSSSYELVPFPAERKAIDIGDYYADYKKIKSKLNWQPKMELKDGLTLTIDFYKKFRKIIGILKLMSKVFIPVSNPKARFINRKNEFLKATESVIEKGMYILGDEVSLFEKEFAEYIGVKYCVGVANGTDAIAIALKALGVKAGDEVITVSHSAVATVAAIEMAGAVPVLADIEPDTRCMDPEKIIKLISPKTKVIIPVHIYGQPARIKEIIAIAHSNGLKVLEDCAQAHGAKVDNKKVGSFGDAAAFSFYPTKNLGAIGDGGAVVTNSFEVFENVLALRQYGWHQRYISDFPGVNSRLDELQAAFLRIKLKELDRDNSRRNEIAEKYSSSIKNLNLQATS